MFQKAIILGSPGAGKSTFARRLRDATGLPLHHLDLIFHRPDRTTVSRQEFDGKLQEILAGDRWIIDGNYNRTIEMRLKRCDAVFLLDLPLEVCLAGIEARVGAAREDMPWYETEVDSEFRQFVLDFPKESLPRVYELIQQYREGKTVVVFKSREEVDTYLKEIGQGR